MYDKRFEFKIGYHCAPVLMGQKPSNLVSFSKEDTPNLPQKINEYKDELKERGVEIKIVCACRKHYQVLVYRPDLLGAYLSEPDNAAFLEEYGYSPRWKLSQKLNYLRLRFEEGDSFPHEMGLFLGYPLEDVLGFCANKGSGCKLCGYWKVYGDVAAAQQRFAVYADCKQRWQMLSEQGYSVLEILDFFYQVMREGA